LISGSPEKVLEEIRAGQRIHYFYWRWDLYKKDDYEPVKVHSEKGIVLTRVHWHGLVLWVSPKLDRGKPLVGFAPGVHTPLVVSENWDIYIIGGEDLSSFNWTALQLFLSYLLGVFSRNPPKEFHEYGNLIVRETPAEEYLFRPERSSYVVVVGKFNEKTVGFFLK